MTQEQCENALAEAKQIADKWRYLAEVSAAALQRAVEQRSRPLAPKIRAHVNAIRKARDMWLANGGEASEYMKDIGDNAAAIAAILEEEGR